MNKLKRYDFNASCSYNGYTIEQHEQGEYVKVDDLREFIHSQMTHSGSLDVVIKLLQSLED